MGLNIVNGDLQYEAGLALYRAGRLEEAAAVFRRILAMNPNHAAAINDLGLIHRDQGRGEEAMAAFRRALELAPEMASAYTNLGLALVDRGQVVEGIALHRRAVALRSDFALAYYNLGCALRDNAEVDAALEAFGKALALVPGAPEARAHLGLLHLTKGEYSKGFELYEARWEWTNAAHRRQFAQPHWDGKRLEGRTLLLHAEQGFGDTLFCIRYAPLLAEGGGRIVVECQKEVAELVRRVQGVDQVVCQGDPLPEFEVHCALLSLPWVCRTTLETIPPGAGYLAADPVKQAAWGERLAGHGRLKVGLSWAGAALHLEDRKRSMRLEALARLSKVPGVTFYCLQKGPAAEEVSDWQTGMELFDFAEEWRDFDDTAAFVANLDLVISVDTAVVHLAGAMGKPVWTLLAYAPDWRWLRGRGDSPWYPTMRLFRQPRPGDWGRVVEEVGAALRAWK